MDDSALGIHIAAEANPREAGLLFYVTSAANNLGEALALFARYSRIVNEAVRIKPVHEPEEIVAEISFVGLSRHTANREPPCLTSSFSAQHSRYATQPRQRFRSRGRGGDGRREEQSGLGRSDPRTLA